MSSVLDDFLNEINEIAPLKINKKKPEWKECLDEKSGFSYFWNTKTDEVTWYKPDSFEALQSDNRLTSRPAPSQLPEFWNRMKEPVKIYKIEADSVTPMKQKKDEAQIVRPKFKKPVDSDDEKITLITSYGSTSESEEDEETSKKCLQNVKKKLDQEATPTKNTEKPQPISGFSLLAHYESDSEDEATSEPEEKTHSTLFPIPPPTNIKDFEEPQIISEQKTEDIVENVSFSRKKRLDVNLDVVQHNSNKKSTEEKRQWKGLGFDSNKTESLDKQKSLYKNFTSGGVEFDKKNSNDDHHSIQDIEGIYNILHDKLLFLCEGNKDVTPVQIILIQIETLFGALKSDCLKPSYLFNWLEGTSQDLEKLEKEAAPDGWLLQWNRSEKRYYYHNPGTGEGQWEYPESDSIRREEAMDICTTPPPTEVTGTDSRQASSPTPPPPPMISQFEVQSSLEISQEPLPPGVDVEPKPNINTVFDSFYSEIAAIEGTSSSTAEPVDSVKETAKKKKKKIKLSQGLSLKKKDVSKLVEKWKNAQKNY